MLEKKVQVSDIQYGNLKSKQGKAVDALDLTKQWMISSDRANNKFRKTTQRGIRTVMNPQISRQYLTNDFMLRYPRLPHPLFTDTMIVGSVSKHVNNNNQFYGTSFVWTHFSQ